MCMRWKCKETSGVAQYPQDCGVVNAAGVFMWFEFVFVANQFCSHPPSPSLQWRRRGRVEDLRVQQFRRAFAMDS